MNTETTTETIQAEHRFNDAEMANLGRQMAAQCQTKTRLEDQLSSIKKDYGAQIQKADLDCDTTASKLRDGFEMRPVSALVQYNFPEKGRKCYFYALPSFEGDWCFPGNLIREEPMTEPDFQRLLPLVETTKAKGFNPHGLSDADVHPDWYLLQEGDPFFDADGFWSPEYGMWLTCKQAPDCLRGGRVAVFAVRREKEHHPEIGDSEREFQEAKSVVETAGQAIGTPVGEVLDGAVSKTQNTPVPIDFNPKDSLDKRLAKWRRGAMRLDWTPAQISLVEDAFRNSASPMEVLKAHSISTSEQRAEELAATFSGTEDK